MLHRAPALLLVANLAYGAHVNVDRARRLEAGSTYASETSISLHETSSRQQSQLDRALSILEQDASNLRAEKDRMDEFDKSANDFAKSVNAKVVEDAERTQAKNELLERLHKTEQVMENVQALDDLRAEKDRMDEFDKSADEFGKKINAKVVVNAERTQAKNELLERLHKTEQLMENVHTLNDLRAEKDRMDEFDKSANEFAKTANARVVVDAKRTQAKSELLELLHKTEEFMENLQSTIQDISQDKSVEKGLEHLHKDASFLEHLVEKLEEEQDKSDAWVAKVTKQGEEMNARPVWTESDLAERKHRSEKLAKAEELLHQVQETLGENSKKPLSFLDLSKIRRDVRELRKTGKPLGKHHGDAHKGMHPHGKHGLPGHGANGQHGPHAHHGRPGKHVQPHGELAAK